MRRILAAALFWLGGIALVAASLSTANAFSSTEGLADLGYFVLALLLFIAAGGLHGAFLLAAPLGTPRWRVGAAAVLAALSVVAVAVPFAQGAGSSVGRVLVFAGALGLVAAAGLVRAPRLWRSYNAPPEP